MSRTYKMHTHKAPRDRRHDKQNKSRKTNFRMRIKSLLRKSTDYEEVFFPAEKSIVSYKTSSGYLSPLDTEEGLIKEILAIRKSIMNGAPEERWCKFSKLEKIIVSAATQKDSSLNGFSEFRKTERDEYLQRAFLILSEEELRGCVHKYFASKGGK